MSSPRPRPKPSTTAPATAAPPADAALQEDAAPPAAPPLPEPAPTLAAPTPLAPPTPPRARHAAAGPPTSGAHEADQAEYTESIIVPSQLALAAVIAIAAAAILLVLGLWPLAVVAVLVIGAVAYYLGVQTLEVTAARISIGQGRGDNAPHLVQDREVVVAEVVELTWPQCFGIGLPDTVDITRFTVRPGPTVSLTMRDGELVRISAADPAAVLATFGR